MEGEIKAADGVKCLVSLNHAISFAEYQLAEPARPGDTYRIRLKGGSRVDEFYIMKWMYHLYGSTAHIHTIRNIANDLIMAELYYERARRSLDACLQLDSNDRLKEHERKSLYSRICDIEKNLWDTCLSHTFYRFMHEGNLCSDIEGEFKQLRKAEYHSQQRLFYAKRIELMSSKDDLVYKAMISCGKVQVISLCFALFYVYCCHLFTFLFDFIFHVCLVNWSVYL